MIHRHELWIEKFSGRLRVPVWIGALVFDAILAVVFPSVSFLGGDWSLFVTTTGYFVLALLPIVFVFNVLPVYIRNQMLSLEEYSLAMVKDRKLVSDKLSSISSLRAVLAVDVIFNLIVSIPFVIADEGRLPFAQNLFVNVAPWFLGLLPVATSLWIFGYSMVGIYRIGRLPMTLQPFTKDRTLGLGPFASVSLRLTAIYYSYIAIQVILDATSVGLSPPVFARDAILVLLGMVLFLLPLFNIHGKLVQAKLEEARWLSERYTLVVERIKSDRDRPLDEGVQRDLLSIDKMQKDVHSIRSWPFDAGVLTKLLTIILSLAAILLSKVLGPVFGLH